jgi:xanthine dehydrogenase accessory factor
VPDTDPSATGGPADATRTTAEHAHADGSDCATAHGTTPGPPTAGTLVAVYAGPVAEVLLRWGRELGYATVLVDPDPTRPTAAHREAADVTVHDVTDLDLDGTTDVVVTDHHRDDIGPVMAPLVRARPRWIGIMGSPRHEGPHVAALAAEGVPEELVATVHRPIGLDIGSRTPAEIALSTLAGLVAARNGRAGGAPAAGPFVAGTRVP